MVLLKTSLRTASLSTRQCIDFFHTLTGAADDFHSWPSDIPGQYINLFKNLAGVIRNKEEVEVKWAETTQVIEMIELAYRSSTEGRTLDVPEL